ncbi:MLV-related proviral Env polyprotein-like [Suncus etruscus]|uniref:MLV-related proviral Env polyprotein-like n=1 Tax=Suncus etruscus TaxID=109475 RepID=UPI00210F4B32|nr:MLV-related proviral Env polyprotein-like [Suncus etruscus]
MCALERGSARILFLFGAKAMPASTTQTLMKPDGSLSAWSSRSSHPGTRPLRFSPLLLFQVIQALFTIMARAQHLLLLHLLTWTPLLLLSFLPLTLCARSPRRASPYVLYNYTWLVIIEAGDVANATSSISTEPPWSPLQSPSGAGTPWPALTSVSKLFMSALAVTATVLLPPNAVMPPTIFANPGAAKPPETALGTPSSSWDFISVRKAATTSSCHSQTWCDPLTISFTAASRDKSKWTHPNRWGLRLYTTGADPGLLFTIQLLISLPRPRQPFSLGPNVLQAPRPYVTPPHPPTPWPSLSHIPSRAPALFLTPTGYPSLQLTVPPSAPSDASRLLDLMNASAMAITVPAYKACWICFSPAPPFYEGVAVLDTPLPTSDPNSLPWGIDNDHAITVSQVVGFGLCLRPNHTRLPPQLDSTCNSTLVLPGRFRDPFLLAPNGTYFACVSGLSPHIIIDAFVATHDYCVLILLLPRLSVHHTEDLLMSRLSGPGYRRSKREPITTITVGVLLAQGASGAGTGIASLVETHDQYRHLAVLQRKVDSDIAELKQGLKHLTNTISLAEMVLQNRRGLNLAFLKEGGLCTALKEECCVFKDETGLIRDSIKRVENSLEERRREIDQSESWYGNWFSTTPWLSTLLPAFLGPFIGFLLLISFGPWAFRRLTSFVKSQIDDATKNNPHILYQRLSTSEDTPAPKAPTTAAKPPLQFEILEQLANRPPCVCSWLTRLWRRCKPC